MEDTSVRVCDLMSYHKELEQEELFLTALVSKIDKQIHALQVEQLHLLNTVKNPPGSSSENYENTETEANEPSEKENNLPVENDELDLRPIKKFDVSEFEEEDEDNEEENMPDNSADFDYL
ncbi:uncharacterized protein LOC117181767 [Belonocnema kinseyi]|uniref:uncharacterized protein LOC117181767 n=1 Tax=Belonocnema kinseyi TaxID=2817044 RepID=UPI00143D32E7|nr:uncharacterized protein LOC117181767 [Belonocnema kinseyi]